MDDVHVKHDVKWAVVVAKLADWLLPKPVFLMVQAIRA